MVSVVASPPASIAIRRSARDVYDELRVERLQTLVGPEDDMWATLADLGEPCALVVGEEIAGCCSVDDEHQLRLLHVRDEFEELAAPLFTHVVDQMAVVAALPCTVDPLFLALSLGAGGRAELVALMFEQVAEPENRTLADVRLATPADHAAAVAFDMAATDSSEVFLEPFLAERIDRDELYLVGTGGEIIASGEVRVDRRSPSHAHLGIVVRSDLRRQGVGTQLLCTLVGISRTIGMIPLCSTEPSNVAAQRAIRRAGFRTRHHVFRVDTTGWRSS